MKKEPPKRRFEVRIKVCGDEWNDVIFTLRDLFVHIEVHGPKCNSVMGGVNSGHMVDIEENPEMTHEKFVQALDEWKKNRETN